MPTPLPDRRQMLNRSALWSLGLAAGMLAWRQRQALAIDENKPGAAMRFGLVTYQWGRDWDIPTLIRNCLDSGAEGVELRTTHAHKVEPDLSAMQRDEVRARFQDSSITLVGLGSDERFDHADPGKLKNALEKTRQFIHLSHDVGGSGVKVKPDSFHKDVPKEKTIEQVGKALRELGEFATGFGQQIRVEVHGSIGDDFPAIQKVMQIADHDAVRCCWNCNDADFKGDGLDKNFARLRDYFGATLHVRELDIGPYPYARLFELLAKTDYDGWVLLEARTEPADRVTALAKQYEVWDRMLTEAQGKLP